MKRIAIDFAPPSLARSWYRLGPRGWALLAIGLLLCGAAALLGAHMLARQRALESQLALVRAAANRPAAAAAAATQRAMAAQAAQATAPLVLGTAQAAAINGAILQLNVPWSALRAAVAAATPPTVALLALEPEARRRSLKMTAETKDADAMVAYVEQLKRQALFGEVVLLRHEINELDPNRPVRFEIDASWNASGDPDAKADPNAAGSTP